MIRAYSSLKSKIQYLKILEYIHLSFIQDANIQNHLLDGGGGGGAYATNAITYIVLWYSYGGPS